MRWGGYMISWRKNIRTHPIAPRQQVSFNNVLPDPRDCSYNAIAQKFTVLSVHSSEKRKPDEAQYSARGFHYAEWWNRNGASAVCCLLMHRWTTDKGKKTDFNQTRGFDSRNLGSFWVASENVRQYNGIFKLFRHSFLFWCCTWKTITQSRFGFNPMCINALHWS